MKTYNLKFITPAFLCGANQSKAELRAPSIRGALRWWFRVLGGTREEEESVFGSVRGKAKESKVVVRCEEETPVHGRFESQSPYLTFFVTHGGERNQPNAYFAAGTTFKIIIDSSALVDDEIEAKFDRALKCFLLLGTLGSRATRGFGAFVTEPSLTQDEFKTQVEELTSGSDLIVRLARYNYDVKAENWADVRRLHQQYGGSEFAYCMENKSAKIFDSAKDAQRFLGGWLRGIRLATGCNGKTDQSAFGYIAGGRLSSALKLRPVQVREGFLPVVIYTDKAKPKAIDSQRNDIEKYSEDL